MKEENSNIYQASKGDGVVLAKGFGKNSYLFSRNLIKLKTVVRWIGKSENSIYFSKKHQVYAVRYKTRKMYEILVDTYNTYHGLISKKI